MALHNPQVYLLEFGGLQYQMKLNEMKKTASFFKL